MNSKHFSVALTQTKLVFKDCNKRTINALRKLEVIRNHNTRVDNCNEAIKERQEEEQIKRERRARIAEYEAMLAAERETKAAEFAKNCDAKAEQAIKDLDKSLKNMIHG